MEFQFQNYIQCRNDTKYITFLNWKLIFPIDNDSQSRIQKVLSGEGVQKFRLLFFALAILFSHWRGAYHYSKWPSSAHQRTPIHPSCPLDQYMIACLNSLRPIWAYNRLAFVQTVEKNSVFFFLNQHLILRRNYPL